MTHSWLTPTLLPHCFELFPISALLCSYQGLSPFIQPALTLLHHLFILTSLSHSLSSIDHVYSHWLAFSSIPSFSSLHWLLSSPSLTLNLCGSSWLQKATRPYLPKLL
jgi:hypothetical protein